MSKQQYPPAPSVDERLIGNDDPMNRQWWLGFSVFCLLGLGSVVFLIVWFAMSMK